MASKQNRTNHREKKVSTSQTGGKVQAKENGSETIPRDSHKGPVIRHGDERSGNSETSSPSSYKRYSVLLIHDDNFKDFDGKQFNRQFHVHTFKADSYADLSKQSKQLNSTIKRLMPDCLGPGKGPGSSFKHPSTLSIIQQ